ncbi:peroxiredoxin family protein [Pedobacter borealis]|uniref:peroxiredoxin family protein n=1 Tax=Pedobacter borealis TaxID=475254 RepID=UPI00068AF37D|nr:TlpA disulfide reductase family protein [Pedobacter borealis]
MNQMTKSILFLLFGVIACAVLTFAQPAPHSFKITGTIKGNPQIRKIRVWGVYGKPAIEVPVKNGQYSIRVTITEPVIMNLQGLGNEDDVDYDYRISRYELYLVPGNVVLVSNKTLSNTQASGSGSHWNKDYHYLDRQVKNTHNLNVTASTDRINLYGKTEIYRRGKALASYGSKEYSRDSIQFIKATYLADGGLDSILDHGILIPYVKKHPESPLALWALFNMGGRRKTIDYPLQFPLFERLLPQIKALSTAKAFKEKLEQNSITQIGKTAPNFILPDTLGQNLSLSSLRGKYVLVDFWADWCAPCRKEFPYLRSAYNKYKDKNFAILGISALTIMSPENIIKWKEAIVKDESNWLHVFDEKGNIAKLYSVSSIPCNFLLDPNGVIIAVNLRGKAVEKKLKELLGD